MSNHLPVGPEPSERAPETLVEALLRLWWREPDPPRTVSAALIRLLWTNSWSKPLIITAALLSTLAVLFITASRAYSWSTNALSEIRQDALEESGYETLYQHHGANDPLQEHFAMVSKGAKVEPTTDGWRIEQGDSEPTYLGTLTPNQVHVVRSQGWEIVLRARIEQQFYTAGGIFADIDTGETRFDINMWHDFQVSGQDFVRLNNGVLTAVPPSTQKFKDTAILGDAVVLDPGLHTFKLIYERKRQSAKLLIDDREVFSGYKGHHSYVSKDRPAFMFGADYVRAVIQEASFRIPSATGIPSRTVLALLIRRLLGLSPDAGIPEQ